MRVGNFEDSGESRTGHRRSSLFQVGDFGATVSERAASWTRPKTGRPKPVFTYDWHVDRQRTEREPTPLDRGGRPEYWETYLAQGQEPTMAAVKSAALKAMEQLRAERIASGGDVGYGDAPTGDEIRAATSSAHSGEPRAVRATAKHPGEAKEGAEALRTPHGPAAARRPDISAALDQDQKERGDNRTTIAITCLYSDRVTDQSGWHRFSGGSLSGAIDTLRAHYGVEFTNPVVLLDDKGVMEREVRVFDTQPASGLAADGGNAHKPETGLPPRFALQSFPHGPDAALRSGNGTPSPSQPAHPTVHSNPGQSPRATKGRR
jgi:hypothetical protein